MIYKIILAVIVVVAASVLAVSIFRGSELSKRVVCAGNLKNIGTSAQLYVRKDAAPGTPMFQRLVESGNIPKQTLICPSSGLDTCN